MRRAIKEYFYLLKASLCLLGIRDYEPSLCIVLSSYLIGTTNHTHVLEILHIRTEDSPYEGIYLFKRCVIKIICVLYVISLEPGCQELGPEEPNLSQSQNITP